jgi:hypothetical protein
VSVWVQAFPSLQDVPSGRLVYWHKPEVKSQWTLLWQAPGGVQSLSVVHAQLFTPAWQMPAWHTSGPAQLRPPSQAMPETGALRQPPSWTLQLEVEH